jgi:hypothetical protein
LFASDTEPYGDRIRVAAVASRIYVPLLAIGAFKNRELGFHETFGRGLVERAHPSTLKAYRKQ